MFINENNFRGIVMKKTLIKQSTGGNEFISLGATIFFLAGTILMIISKIQDKKYAFTWIIVVFSIITLMMAYVTTRLFICKNVLVEEDGILYLRGLFGDAKLRKEDIVQVTKYSATNEIKLNIHHEDRNVERTYVIKELSQEFIDMYMTKE